MPRLSVEGVACLTATLPPIMRLAELPPDKLQGALDALLHSGRTLMLQVRPRCACACSYSAWPPGPPALAEPLLLLPPCQRHPPTAAAPPVPPPRVPRPC